MRTAFSVDAIRTAEDALMATLPDGALMQRAVAGLTGVLVEELGLRRARPAEARLRPAHPAVARRRGGVYGSSVLIIAGGGNNAGDGIFAGARLARRGSAVRVVRTGERTHAEALAALVAAGGREVGPEHALTMINSGSVDLVVDAVLGIGGRAGLTGVAARLAAACATADARVVAVDLPSGVAADSGEVGPGAFTATRTVTFGGLRHCHLVQPGRGRCGRVELVDLGLDLAEPSLFGWQVDDVIRHWPRPDPLGDKYAKGVVGVDAGSAHYPGAAVLATTGAVRAGAGMVRFLGDAAAATEVLRALPNVVPAEGRVQAHLLGSGWGERPDGRTAIASVTAAGLPAVLDADALSHLRGLRLGPRVLLTPHAGELARLLGIDRSEVTADPVTAVRRAVEETGAAVLLKGATQYVAEPGNDRVRIAVPGPAWTGQAGSGDVLAGICATLLAAGLPPGDAALAGASIQAIAADRCRGPVPPQELAATLPGVLRDLGIASRRES